MLVFGFLTCLTVWLPTQIALLETSQAEEKPAKPNWVKEVTLQPAKIPFRALAHPLLPPTAELVSGNAALCYYRAFSPETFSHSRNDKDWWKKEEAWSKAKLQDLPQKEMEFLLRYWPLEQIEQGARRTYCDWEMTDRLKKDGFSALLPDVQSMRELARLLSHRIRLKLARKDYEAALRDIQTLIGLGRHVGDGPTVIQHLVGNALCSIALERLEEGMQQPDFPSVHWDLSVLPVPFLTLETALGGERIGADSLLSIQDLNRVMSKEEANEKMAKFQKQLGMLSSGDNNYQAAVLAISLISYTQSKEWLVNQGTPRETVEKMPVSQVVMLRMAGEFNRERDEMFKYANLPLWQAAPLLDELDRQLRPGTGQSVSKILARLLLPALHKVFEARVRLDRRIATLRQVEAIRLHATKTGSLPEKLEDTQMPLALDPWHGKPFEYTRTSPTEATLTGKPLGKGTMGLHNTVLYEIHWKK